MSAYTANSRFGTVLNGTTVTEEITKNYQYEVTGSLIHLEDSQTYGSGFTVRKFVIMDDASFPSPICFELIKDDTSKIDQFSPGDRLKVTFKLKGREWNGKYFTNLQAIQIEVEKEVTSADKKEEEEIVGDQEQ